jgi:ergothioneine biosynthesis protein EgtB
VIRNSLIERFRRVRAATEALAAPLSDEDQGLQSMPDCSPTKWHRAHTTWFFEQFVLSQLGVAPRDSRYAFLFNSYYEAVGPRHARPKRGLLSRPSVSEVAEWRRVVDATLVEKLSAADAATLERLSPLIELGLAHEEQHQELLLTDILHAFSENPLKPAYRTRLRAHTAATAAPLQFVELPGGLQEIGAQGSGFSFDNESPRHKVWLEPFALAGRLLTWGEWRAFAREGGYTTPSLWLSEGWEAARAGAWTAPLYARLEGDAVVRFGLDGEREAELDEPVTHLSFYEADALARFMGARLPTEAEWEAAAAKQAVEGNFANPGALEARPSRGEGLTQLFGDAWEWTRSAYEPYPGFKPAAGAVGEYNGKFMIGQLVLRGGSAFTPSGHVRASYRNFWPAATRFQLTGVRLARDL